MPTLKWVIRASTSGGDRARRTSAAAAAVPKPIASAATSVPVPDSLSAVSASVSAVRDPMLVARPAVSSKRNAGGGKGRKRERNPRTNAGTSARKKFKAASDLDLPTGVYKTSSGKFRSEISWRGKMRYIGMFDTAEQASAAYLYARKYLDNATVSSCGAAQVDAMFDAAKKTAQESVGIVKRNPRGVYELRSGKFQSSIRWGDKTRYIGTFDTPEQASAAHTSARKDLGHAKQSARGSDNNKVKNAAFDAAKKKALEAAQAA